MSPDTNVLVRLIVRDDPEQTRRAEGEWKKALATDGVFVSKIVVVETVWVLRRAYRVGRVDIARTLRAFLGIEGVVLEDESAVFSALGRFESGAADLSDYLILEAARAGSALPVVTFDADFSREPDVRTPAL